MWGQLAIKALISGVLIAAASEIARRSPGWGGLIASLPLVSFLTMLWLWHDGAGAGRIADLALSSTAYVVASLPAFLILAAVLRVGGSVPVALLAFVLAAFAGYRAMMRFGPLLGLPV